MNRIERTHGSLNHASGQSEVALLLIDVINDLEFPGGEELLSHAVKMADALAALKARAKMQGIPVIYANDNFGRWRSDFQSLVGHCMQDGVRGRAVVSRLQPEHDDYFVLKPKHSAFFQTNLQILLDYLGVATLILTGIAADICVLFTANDAYMRDFRIIVPPDCTASENAEHKDAALTLMQRVLKSDLIPSSELLAGKLADYLNKSSS